MIKENQSLHYYMSSISNFITAFGGGMILGKGVDIISSPYLQGGSILAFFVGSVLGLTFLQFIPKYLSTKISKWFSIYGGTSSILLLFIYMNYSNDGKIAN